MLAQTRGLEKVQKDMRFGLPGRSALNVHRRLRRGDSCTGVAQDPHPKVFQSS